jgi:deazaflavin-dependent oxidoreductase (nitroreductase family)
LFDVANDRYVRPPWAQRNIANRIAPLVRPSIVSRLSVPGRRTGKWRTTPVSVFTYEGERYIVSAWGVSDWALNLRAALHGRLTNSGRVEVIEVVEVPVSERGPIVEAYGVHFAAMPNMTELMRSLPDPADHPTFRITATRT